MVSQVSGHCWQYCCHASRAVAIERIWAEHRACLRRAPGHMPFCIQQLDRGIAIRVDSCTIADVSLCVGQLNLDCRALTRAYAETPYLDAVPLYTLTPAPPGPGWIG
jgi:hypothetical protein